MVVVIDEATLRMVKGFFRALRNPVRIVVFVTRGHCLYCNETVEIVEKLASISPELIRVEKCECEVSSPEARSYKVDRHPAIVLRGEKEYWVRYFGIPSGYEFGSLVEDIVDVSRGEVELEESVKAAILAISKPVHIKVFVTPTCPYCPSAVRTAHKFAIVNTHIMADAVESLEFPDLARKYRVYAVPKVVINDVVEFEGALPERVFADKVLQALKVSEK
ncbi:MAG: thioredoxin family protein [Candidatus Nezhaarchaeales archaeon]